MGYESTTSSERPVDGLKQIAPSPPTKPPRLASLDAYRGFIMLAMASAGFGLVQVAKKFPGTYWEPLAYQADHVPWSGCTFWDLIQPSFMFMVGVAMPYSYAGRRQRGDSYAALLTHAVMRSILLVALGVFLASNSEKQTNFIFTNVLAQIGLGYTFVFLLMDRGRRTQWIAAAAVLAGYWLLFYAYPLPEASYDYAQAGITPKELASGNVILPGVAGHWSKSTNMAAAVDRKLLNFFPRKEPYAFNVGGYQTLNFIPSMATMIFGLIAGELLRSGKTDREKLAWLIRAGALCLVAGLAVGLTICPIVKRIWTPSWALCSGGAAFWFLAAFYYVIDMRGFRRWAFPLIVVGTNSIVMYMMSQLLKPWIRSTLTINLGYFDPRDWHIGSLPLRNPFAPEIFDGPYGPIVQATSGLVFLWLACWWLYRQKIFVRI